MEPKDEKRSKWLNIRMTETEYEQVEKLRQQSTCKSISDYARKTVLGKPVIMRYRNQSLDDFMASMLQLQNELNAIGNNFNQSVRRLHTLRQLPDLQQWILINEQDKTQLFHKIENITHTIHKAYQLWSRV
ncbi:plasmid mobilization relaxosome protein MobC [Flavitalea sp. BT771]|uniref:plasmid mobilization protein n=1 Tax=Flavitalea sp. BT771 TaxID=3063329 RepID=UPI0026E1990D|nr:plasmid mobilization relaxosome protein MobC [Flavitalea sp. BT771]MDO6431545.1 plasmid mobilization relaxosome protein MobC [Flavitalea sp. BT771]MDV6220453.1 plasmid mobilization relaxosome protein MobC [Flavitalea sp. BT771]